MKRTPKVFTNFQGSFREEADFSKSITIKIVTIGH